MSHWILTSALFAAAISVSEANAGIQVDEIRDLPATPSVSEQFVIASKVFPACLLVVVQDHNHRSLTAPNGKRYDFEYDDDGRIVGATLDGYSVRMNYVGERKVVVTRPDGSTFELAGTQTPYAWASRRAFPSIDYFVTRLCKHFSGTKYFGQDNDPLDYALLSSPNYWDSEFDWQYLMELDSAWANKPKPPRGSFECFLVIDDCKTNVCNELFDGFNSLVCGPVTIVSTDVFGLLGGAVVSVSCGLGNQWARSRCLDRCTLKCQD